MIEPLPNVIGYPLERAAKMLADVGASVADVQHIGPNPADDADHRRSMVIRQRCPESGKVELTVAREWRVPLAAPEQ
jgi:hypothetical protein